MKKEWFKKYFDGPSGVYYSPKNNDLIVLWKNYCASIVNMKTHDRLGGVYDMQWQRGNKNIKKRTSLVGMQDCIYLGDL